MPSNSECTSLHHASPTHASAEVYITYRPNALTTDRCYSRPNDNNSNTNNHNIIKITRRMTYTIWNERCLLTHKQYVQEAFKNMSSHLSLVCTKQLIAIVIGDLCLKNV